MKPKIIISASVAIIIMIIIALFLATRTSPSTKVYVDPTTVERAVSQNFTVSIYASSVTDLYGWEFKLGWNQTILDLVNVMEGTFLKEKGPTFLTSKLNSTIGYVLVDCSLLGDTTGVNGTGLLASIEFQVKETGNCKLDVYDTKLVDPNGETISHTTADAHFSTTSSY